MYQWVRPRFAIPVHGETKHLSAHCELARDAGVEEALLVENGAVVRFTPGRMERIGRVATGRLTFDGRQLISLEGSALHARRRMLTDGAALVTVAVDQAGKAVASPQITVNGLGDGAESDALYVHLRGLVQEAVTSMPNARRRDDEAMKEAVRVTLRRALRSRFGKRPVIDVHVVRI